MLDGLEGCWGASDWVSWVSRGSLRPLGPLGLLGRLGFPLPDLRRRFQRPKPILPVGERVGVKHDGFCCNVLPGGCLLWSRRSMAHGILGGRRLGSLGSRGSLVGLGLVAVIVIESVDLFDRARSKCEALCQGIGILTAFEIG